MRGCFICGGSKNHGTFTVGVWQAVSNLSLFGLGSVDPKDGQVCCSFREGEFANREEAAEAAREADVQELYGELQSKQENDDYDYGPADSDPFDREPIDY